MPLCIWCEVALLGGEAEPVVSGGYQCQWWEWQCADEHACLARCLDWPRRPLERRRVVAELVL